MKVNVRRVQRKFGGFLTTLIIVFFFTVSTNTAGAQDNRQPLRQYQPPAQPSTVTTPAPSVVVTPNEDYRIGAGDVIEVTVQDAPEMSGSFRVAASGSFRMPFVGDVAADKKTSEELAQVIAGGLRAGYLTNPHVNVTVKQINSHSFFIQGAVRRPGLYYIEGRPSLLKLITVAGGLADYYGSTVFIIRETKAADTSRNTSPGGEAKIVSTSTTATTQVTDTESAGDEAAADVAQYELVKANINSLLKGNFDQNVVVEPGDIVHIPPTDVFFVAGEVNSPGSFQLKDGTTLRQAISLAQGMNFQAAGGRGIIFRENPNTGKRQELKVDVGAVMNGKHEDIAIMANDIIIVPNSRAKTITGTVLKAFGANAPRAIFRY